MWHQELVLISKEPLKRKTVLQRTIKEPLFLRVSLSFENTPHGFEAERLHKMKKHLTHIYCIFFDCSHTLWVSMRALLCQWMIYSDKAWAGEGDWLSMKSFTGLGEVMETDSTHTIVPCHLTPAITGAILNFFVLKKGLSIGVFFFIQ